MQLPQEIAEQNISQMGVSPEGYKLATGTVPQDIVKRCIELLSQQYGYEEYITSIINNKNYFIRVEPHSWYGADKTKQDKWHKGSTVYAEAQ